MELQTERLVLRPWREEDAESLYKYASDERIGFRTGFPVHTSVENSREIIRDVLAVEESYAIVLKESEEVIGSISFKENDMSEEFVASSHQKDEIGYWIGAPYWGRSFAPEALGELIRHGFEDLDLDVIWCAYHEGNEPSKRVQEKLGFHYDHTEKDKLVPLLNERRTSYFNKLTRDEWLSQQN